MLGTQQAMLGTMTRLSWHCLVFPYCGVACNMLGCRFFISYFTHNMKRVKRLHSFYNGAALVIRRTEVMAFSRELMADPPRPLPQVLLYRHCAGSRC